MYAYVVPRDPESGRLNAKRWLGGARALRDMQTEFVQDVGQQHGLERGIEGSKAKHTTIKQHYAAISKPVPNPNSDRVRATKNHQKSRIDGQAHGQV